MDVLLGILGFENRNCAGDQVGDFVVDLRPRKTMRSLRRRE
jgi:hypothetical protein